MSTMPTQQNVAELIQLKLEAFERLQDEFEASFQFAQTSQTLRPILCYDR